MTSAKRPYGPWSREMLAGLRARGLLKVEALVEALRARGVDVDRTLVSHWAAGRTHLPADLLPHLAALAGRPELVFGPYLDAVGCALFDVPQGDRCGRDLTDHVLEAAVVLGELQEALFHARAPASPGGATLTADERRHLQQHVDELLHVLGDLKARLFDKTAK